MFYPPNWKFGYFNVAVTIWTVCAISFDKTYHVQAKTAKDILPSDCGKWDNFPQVRRIGGGFAAREGQFPSFVHLESKTSPWSIRGAYCGGTILSKNLVLTAGHCIVDELGREMKHVQVQTGIRLNRGDKYVVERICKPYNMIISPQTIKHDLAVLRLKTSISFNENVQPTCILNRETRNNEQAYCIGMGAYRNVEGEVSDFLKVLPVMKTRCNSGIDRSNICFEANNRQYDGRFCSGDSGSGLYVMEKDRLHIVGVVSHKLSSDNSCVAKKSTLMFSGTYNQAKILSDLIVQCG